ncbi:hypothetical protein MKX07_008225 [Trichoderma sp. CBMAI-0711]|nr:hypothetical protein MKX07_008225 [Trichoderma sp. CBMAI-0711]
MALQTVTFPIIPVVKTHLIINSVLVGAAVVIVGFRLFARIVTGAKLWWDDYLILLSMPLGIDAPMGVGRQISETQPNLVIILKLTITYALTYTACITIVKLSILSFYLRVFPNSTLRIATQIVIGIVSLWGLGSVLMFFFVCRPFEATWNPLVGGTCADRIATFLAVGAYNIISDIIILALPLRTIWTLNTRSQMKVALTVLFLTGLLVSVVAVCRVITLTHLNMDNVTGTMVWADFLSTLEANLGIICAVERESWEDAAFSTIPDNKARDVAAEGNVLALRLSHCNRFMIMEQTQTMLRLCLSCNRPAQMEVRRI